jgi:hypothetical protein
LGPKRWREFRAKLVAVSKPGCAICGSRQGSLHAHEEWEYIEGKNSGVARLKCINLVCQDCHSIHHIGRTQRLLVEGCITQATWDRLIGHFLRVNSCDMAS